MERETILKFSMQKLLKNLIQYGIVGGIAALAEWISFYIGNELIGVNHMWSTCIGFLAGTATNYLLSSRFVFKKTKYNKGSEVFLVYLVSLIGLLCNLGLMRLFVDGWDMRPMYSKVLATGIVFLWNFMSRRFLIYNEKHLSRITRAAGVASGAVYHVGPVDARDLSTVQAFIADKLSWDVDRASISYDSAQPPYHCYTIEYDSVHYLALLRDAGNREEYHHAEPTYTGELHFMDSKTGNRIIRLKAG